MVLTSCFCRCKRIRLYNKIGSSFFPGPNPLPKEKPGCPKRQSGYRFSLVKSGFHYTARVTLPERRQRVQALMRQGVPLTIAFTRFTLGFQVRLERRWEWETLMPKETSLLQISHLAMVCTSFSNSHNKNIIADSPAKCKAFFQNNAIYADGIETEHKILQDCTPEGRRTGPQPLEAAALPVL